MAQPAIVLNISEMIDLAIGTPEVGVVDFCMLHTVLHCLAQQLAVREKHVELRGSVANLPVGRDNSQTVTVNEYVVETDAKGPADVKTLKEVKHDKKKTEEPDTLLIVERVHKEGRPSSPTREAGVAATPAAAKAPTAATAATAPLTPASQPGGGPPRQSIAPAQISSSEKLSLVTISKFNVLENVVEDLKERVYGSMPKNEEILEEVRSQTNLKSITDMWTSLNVSSRLEAAEAGVAKLSSLVEDLIRETGNASKISALTETATVPIERTEPIEKGQTVTPAGVNKEDLSAIKSQMQRMRDDLEKLSNQFYQALQDIEAFRTLSQIEVKSMTSVAPSMKETVGEQTKSVMAATKPASTEAESPKPDRRPTEIPRQTAGVNADVMDRIMELEKRIQKCCDAIGKSDGVVQDQINNFQDQLEYLMKQVADITQDLNAGKLSPDLIKDLQGLMQLFQTVQDMQDQLKQVHDTALQLAAEKEDRQHHMNALLEQIELLKTIKLDREDMVEAMADKADLRMLARKVSHDQFEMACDDLSRGLEHTIGKLNMQESLWQQALDDIQREIENKLDKMELSPVKEFFNNKLRQLQENLKQMASLRREVEAAGTKRKLLRDVNCISCDAQAVMAMESTAAVSSKPLPANLSMKPYLTYELDAIRKAQASNMPQRNMHDWETIDKQMSQPKQPQKVRSETNKHICNRYCGGSHTVTTPAQRVARLGHFMKQWGPDVVPLSSGFACGDDGRMYKVSPAEEVAVGPDGAADQTCTKKPKGPDIPNLGQMAGGPECRCLDGDQTKK